MRFALGITWWRGSANSVINPERPKKKNDMASRAENRVVNLAGLVQGITLVTFPAASSIFTTQPGMT